jgi:predicted transcriptional regulator
VKNILGIFQNISGGLLIIFIQNSVILSQSYDFQFHHPQLNEHQFSQQQKQVEASVENYNRHQIQNLKSELLSVHHADSGPQFDFAVNQNYSDLEKASEMFINSGHILEKQKTTPKVIKITKTVRVYCICKFFLV